MTTNAIIRCEKCDSEKIIFTKRKVGSEYITDFCCANPKCHHPSPARDYLDGGLVLQNYVDDYWKVNPIRCTEDEFKNKVIQSIINQITDTYVRDDRGLLVVYDEGYKPLLE